VTVGLSSGERGLFRSSGAITAFLDGLRRVVDRGIDMKTRNTVTVTIDVKIDMAAIARALALFVFILV